MCRIEATTDLPLASFLEDYVYHYHTGQLKTPSGELLTSTFGNAPVVMPNDAAKIAAFLDSGKA